MVVVVVVVDDEAFRIVGININEEKYSNLISKVFSNKFIFSVSGSKSSNC